MLPNPMETSMKSLLTASAIALLIASPLALATDPPKEKITVQGVVELKDGGTISIDEQGRTYHVDKAGKRVRMKDGVVMEGKDGTKYLHKNDAIWKQITEKGTLAPNR